MNKINLSHPQADELTVLFQNIREDRSRGSRELTALLLEETLLWSLEIKQIDKRQVEEICRRLTKLRPEMAAIINTGYLLWDRFNESLDEQDTLNAFRRALRTLRSTGENLDQELIKHTRRANLKDRDIMTFSRSSTVIKLMSELENIEKAVVLHSYPGEEGIDSAEDLSENIEVTFAYDMEAGYFLPRVDALYLGADALLHDGSIVNKLGSRLLARSAVDTPVRVVSDIYKYTPVDKIANNPRYPSPEDLAADLKRDHPIFETVPARLIDSYLTNRGCFTNKTELLENISDLRKAHKKLED
ncbi:MAG: hypothetical protein ACQEP7_07070 [bacterium]